MGSKKYGFVAKLAFICNLLFLGCLIVRYSNVQAPEFFKNFMIIAGWILAPVVNVFAHFILVVLRANGRKNLAPQWIIIFNLFWLVFQFLYFFVAQNY
jgi:hypothetical protein